MLSKWGVLYDTAPCADNYFFIRLDDDFLDAFFAFRSNFLNPLLVAALPAVFLATFLGADYLGLVGDFFLANYLFNRFFDNFEFVGNAIHDFFFAFHNIVADATDDLTGLLNNSFVIRFLRC